jgi:exopolysaccharide biosynthesis polyprenyl glycosylphosphotransferase
VGQSRTTRLGVDSLGRIQLLGDFVAASLASTMSMLTVRQPDLTLLLLVTWPCGIAILGQRDGRAKRLNTRALWRWALASVAVVAVANLAIANPGSVRVTVAIILAALISTAMRLLLARLRIVPRQGAQESAVLIGGVDSVAEIAERWDRTESGLKPIGVCLNISDTPVEGLEGIGHALPLLGSPSEAAASAELVDADVVAVLPGAGLSHSDLRRLAWVLEPTKTRLCVVTPLQDVDRGRVRARTEDGRLVLDLLPRRSQGWIAVAKSAIDWVAAVAFSILALPVLAVLLLLVRLDSSGPALFRQTRVGTGGKTFTMLKLRTMQLDAEERRTELSPTNEHLDGPLFKMENDPRITRFGRFLRRTSLDELPQLVNVLRGQMSLIGPRPALPEEVARYDDWARRRLAIKPGMTGLWQVSGRSNLAWSDSVRLDLDYVDNWTPSMDARIAAKTAGAVFRRDGAY